MVDKWNGTIEKEYGWVIMVALASWFLNLFQFFFIGRSRKSEGVPPPIMYAEGKDKFNGAQRAHQNTLEALPFFLMAMLLAGIRHPIEAASLGGGWILARLLFSVGYYSGHVNYRMPGFFLTLAVQAALVGFAISAAAGFLDWW